MAYKTYWSIPGLQGGGFPKEEELLSYSFGHGMAGQLATGGSKESRTSGNHDVTVMRPGDSNTGRLVHAAISSMHLGEIKFWSTQQKDKTILTVVKYTFKDCIITVVKPHGSHTGEDPVDEVSFNFGDYEIEYGKH
jgi:type VI protein secretion system component Hcp